MGPENSAEASGSTFTFADAARRGGPANASCIRARKLNAIPPRMTSLVSHHGEGRAPRRTLRERLHLAPNSNAARAFRLLFGRPLATDEAHEQKVGAWR